MAAAPNDSAAVGGATTVTLAAAGALLPPSVELTVTELFLAPAAVPVTFTLHWHPRCKQPAR